MSEIAVCDEHGRTIGHAEKSEAHTKGMLHRSVLLAVTRDRQLLVYLRGPDQNPGLCWDMPGGHADLADKDIHATAAREFSEEILAMTHGNRMPMSATTLELLGKENQLRSYAPQNQELTTAFAVRLPPDACLSVQDEGANGVVEREFRFSTVDELRRWLREGSPAIADGLRRFLSALDQDRLFRCDFYRILEHQKWLISFACTLPEQPGCGCPDGDFYAEHDFVGSFAEAEETAQQISREQYCGDFCWWLTPKEEAHGT